MAGGGEGGDDGIDEEDDTDVLSAPLTEPAVCALKEQDENRREEGFEEGRWWW